MTLKWN